MTKYFKKPLVYGIACESGKIIYRCADCGNVFNMANSDYNYCYRCGTLLSWDVIKTINEDACNTYMQTNSDGRINMRRALDVINSRIPVDPRLI